MFGYVIMAFFVFAFLIVRMGIRHSENLERIKHGYPLLDGSRPINKEVIEAEPFETRLQ